MVEFFIFVSGLMAGSFLNVCILRIPRGESIVMPRSKCPKCGQQICGYDNIPLVSYVLLGAKCRSCRAGISPRYFLIELTTGVMGLALWLFYGPTWFFAAAVILFSILLSITVTDFETGLIPDKFTLPGMVLGLCVSALGPEIHDESLWFLGLLRSVLGLLAGGGILWLVAVIGDFVFKKESMGGGDIKLLAAIGAFTGYEKAALVFFIAPMLALPFALYMKFIRKSETVVYGPFLAIAGAVVYIFGNKLLYYLFL